MVHFSLPYGRSYVDIDIPDVYQPELIAPTTVPAASDPLTVVNKALAQPVGNIHLADFANVSSVAIAINDKTRPVPHKYLLPPLLHQLEALGLSSEHIKLIIATGTHPPMPQAEFTAVVPTEIIGRYPILCHDADARDALVYLGETTRQTPIWINRHYLEADLRIVVGNIEPHQFQGFSGGVKSAAIGLAGRATIDHNHAMMMDPAAQLGAYSHNPARQDVEEIGQLIGVHFALNAILNDHKKIVHVVAGEPTAVMTSGMPLSQQICQVAVSEPFDVVIASPGGYPKDINIYQAQKGLAHAALITKTGGTVILVAACPEGTGSRGYEAWMQGMESHEQIFQRFQHEPFRVGPHKAFQISRDAARVKLLLHSEMQPDFVRALLLNPVANLQETVISTLTKVLSNPIRIGVMPLANATIPAM